MTTKEYINKIKEDYAAGSTTEHTFRPYLKQLVETLDSTIQATNEPKRRACGAPDFILTRTEVPIGFIETKDIGDKDLKGEKKSRNKNQFDRYKESLVNIVFTDYLRFLFYQNKRLVADISIAEIADSGIKIIQKNIGKFEQTLKEFTKNSREPITTSTQLSNLMAKKAKLLAEIIENTLKTDRESSLFQQMGAFETMLIHGITEKEFADAYAQTLVFGMFAARLHDKNPGTFSRQEAAELIPKASPFLRGMFGYISGSDIDDNIKWLVDNLAEMFLCTDMTKILENYGANTGTENALIHFYEDFLSAYDPALKKSRGVWYTPGAVVNFMVRAADHVLKNDLKIKDGLADTTKDENGIHKVQILDPATGTGTFPVAIIRHLFKTFGLDNSLWSDYVENHLLPRINGFELLMASYAMAHVNMDLMLTKTGYKPTNSKRFRIYLTNTLGETVDSQNNLFATWLSKESKEANVVKQATPVMCVIGNPPYSGESANKNSWIDDKLEDYKKEPGGVETLKERTSKWINDDYVKFVRYGQHLIEKNQKGIVVFITPHGFLENATFRGMRWNLLKTFDKIYTIDLHGNTRKKEVSPDGSKDENVFDIMQGVAITILVKSGEKSDEELGKVFHADLYGTRQHKYAYLLNNSLDTIDFTEVNTVEPSYSFKPIDMNSWNNYSKGIKVNDLFTLNSPGILSGKDSILVGFNKESLYLKISAQLEVIKQHYNNHSQIKGEKKRLIQSYTSKNLDTNKIKEYLYRPFDYRHIYYDKNLVYRDGYSVIKHVINKNNYCLLTSRRSEGNSVFVTSKAIPCFHATNDVQICPLYTYENNKKSSNLNPEIRTQFETDLNLKFSDDETNPGDFNSLNVFDYVYAVLHSPKYREDYVEYLKNEFPYIPYPKDKDIFWKLVAHGENLRKLHLLEDINTTVTGYKGAGNNEVQKPEYKDSKVYINKDQHFDSIPEVAWNFQIGRYKPAQLWLKQRKGEKLSYDDVQYYQKMIYALTETDKIMKEINEIDFL